jgi:hypothetical protein
LCGQKRFGDVMTMVTWVLHDVMVMVLQNAEIVVLNGWCVRTNSKVRRHPRNWKRRSDSDVEVE